MVKIQKCRYHIICGRSDTNREKAVTKYLFYTQLFKRKPKHDFHCLLIRFRCWSTRRDCVVSVVTFLSIIHDSGEAETARDLFLCGEDKPHKILSLQGLIS